MVALYKMNNVWIRNFHVKQCTKLKLYKTLVKPILTYNSGTWSPTKKEEIDLDSFHRKQLRHILNVKYPVTMRSETVYRMANEEMLSIDLLKNRWKLFGHVLRMDVESLAHKPMHYFSRSITKQFRGRPRVNMPQKLNEDLLKYGKDRSLKLKTTADLQKLIVIANDRLK